MDTPSKRVEIMPAKRRAMILERLRRDGAASILELAEEIGASASTIRRDLEQLTEGGYLERTHGGALFVPPLQATFEHEPSLNAQLQHPQKRAIGALAALRINPRESVIFDTGSTVLEAVRAAAERQIPLTAVTNSLETASLCAACPSWRVIVPGGTVRAGSQMMVGEPGVRFLRHDPCRSLPRRRLCHHRAHPHRCLARSRLAQARHDPVGAARDPARRQHEIPRPVLLGLLRHLGDLGSHHR